MTRLLVRDLAPGATYYIQVRQVTQDNQSAWGPRLLVLTDQDETIPNAPTGVTWTSVGRSFLAEWVAPTTLVSGQPLNNLDHYEVRISHVASGLSTLYETQSLRFDFTYEMNEAKFGSAKSPLNFEVRAVTNTGNTSLWTAIVTATNPVPGSVTVTPTNAVEAIGLKWTIPSDLDLVGYNVYASQTNGFTPGPGNKVTTVNTPQYIFYTTSTSPWYFHVRAVDIFGQESTSTQVTGTATAATGADTTPPAGPTGVTTTMGFDDVRQVAYATVSWTASVDTDVRSYRIRYAPGAASNWNYVTVPGDQTSVRIDITPGTSYYIAVQAIDFSGNASSFVNSATYPHTSSADVTAPSTPATPTAVGNTMQVQVTHDNTKAAGGAIESDVAYYDVYASKTSGFTTYDSTTYIGKLVKSVVTSETFPLPVTTASGTTADTWYIKVKAVDRAGNASAISAQTTVTPGLIGNANIVDATITSAKIVTLVADKITAGAGIIADLTIGRSADALGSVKSFGYVASSTGFKLDKTGLEINDGTIKAKTLELRDGGNILPPIYTDFEGATSAYLPVSGEPSKIYSVNSTWEIIGISGKFGSNGLRVNRLGTTTGGVALSTVIGSNPYNINVEGLRDYIVSAYFKSSESVLPNVKFALFYNDGTFDGTDAGSTVTSSWARYSKVFTVPATATKAYLYIYSTSAVATSWDIDGVQVEEKIGKLTTPSQWKPSSSTTIDGGQIKTGSIQSNTNITVSGALVPAWYIDLNGRAQFSDATVLGALNIGTETEMAGASYIQSRNYSQDLLLGWKIDSAGQAQFNDAAIRGSITATEAEIVGKLSVTGTLTQAATVDFGNSTTATLANAVSDPSGSPVITPIDYSLTDVPVSTANTTIYDRVVGPAVDSGGNLTYVQLARNVNNIDATFTKTTSAGAVISTTTTTITTYTGPDSTAYIVGFSCYDGTNFSLFYRRSTTELTYRAAVLTSAYALTSDATMTNLNDLSNTYKYGNKIPHMERIGSDVYVAATANTNVNENLVTNPSMENSNPDQAYRGYNASNLVRSTTFVTAGTYGLQITSTGSTTMKGFEVFHPDKTSGFNERACKGGDYIYYSIDGRSSTSVVGAELQIGIKYNNDTESEFTDWMSFPSSGSTTFTGNFVVPAGYTTYRMIFRVRDFNGNDIPNGTNVAYFDRLRVTNNFGRPWQGTFSYADANTSGWVWAGTTNASYSYDNTDSVIGAAIIRKYAVGSYTTPTWTQEGNEFLGGNVVGFKYGQGDYGSGNYLVMVTDEANTGSWWTGSNFYAFPDAGASTTSMVMFEATSVPFGSIAVISNRYHVLDRTRNKLCLLEKTWMPYYTSLHPLVSKINFGYTYYDPDATGGTHETTIGPIGQWDARNQFRKPWRISGVAVPAVPGAVAVTDRPTQVGIYVSAGTDATVRTKMNRLGYFTPVDDIITTPMTSTVQVLGNTVGGVGTVNTVNPNFVSPTTVSGGNQPPASNGFSGIAGFTPAYLQSQALGSSGLPLIRLGGDGVALMSGLKFNAAGLTITDDNGSLAGKLQTETGGFLLNHDGTGAWPALENVRPFEHLAITTTCNVPSTPTVCNSWRLATTNYYRKAGYFTFSSANGSVTVGVAGYYKTWFYMKMQAMNGSTINTTTYDLRLRKNGTNIEEFTMRNQTLGKITLQMPPKVIYLDVGDVLDTTVDMSNNTDSNHPADTNEEASGWFVEYLGPGTAS